MTGLTVQAIRHVGFEDLGSFARPLLEAGYKINYLDAAGDDLSGLDPLGADLLIVLGGPVGVYDDKAYPVLAQELRLLGARLAADRPTLGICLGAQLIAAALGARVYPGPRPEIGWAPLELTTAGQAGPLSALQDTAVLHWHGDTFDLPEGCERLAFTEACAQQAFSRGAHVLGLQFHAEVTAQGFEPWLIGHAFELAISEIDPAQLRAQAAHLAGRLEEQGPALLRRWVEGL